MRITYTVYAKQGSNTRPDGCVGITFPNMSSVSYSELHAVIDQLQAIAKEMKGS